MRLIRIIAVLGLAAANALPAEVVLDRVAVVVGKRAVKSSDINRDVRVTAFLNKEPLSDNPEARKKAADRLVDQQIIRQEIATGEYPRAHDSEAEELVNQIRSSRFAGSDARLVAELNRYRLTKAQLQEHLLWQLTVLRFIDERFRPGVLVVDDDVRKYYDQHLADLRKQNPQDNSFETLEPKIRETLEGEEINKQFDDWLTAARSHIWIEFHSEVIK